MHRQSPALKLFAFIISLVLLHEPGFAEDCQGEFFGPDDAHNEAPLTHPHPEFAQMLQSAEKGVPIEQRNLAISYETGYLVSPCQKAATLWYLRAANSGDEQAKRWVARNQEVRRIRNGPECVGMQCSPGGMGSSKQIVLHPDPRGHYYAPVTINGVTVRGVVDTGASFISMGPTMAQRLGINFRTGQVGRSLTANGSTSVFNLPLRSVSVGGLLVSDVMASVGPVEHELLIGMSFLKRVDLNQDNGSLVLTTR